MSSTDSPSAYHRPRTDRKMPSDDVLIVGACQAGTQIAASLRELGFTAGIVLASAERHRPYQRPPLSKAYLAGKATAESLALRTDAFWTEQDIELLQGTTVTGLDIEAGTANTDDGRVLSFGSLALTTGARPRRLDQLEGSQLRGVLYLRDIDDADKLAKALPMARDVVVIGGGFIGLEAAAVARGLGARVTVVESLPRLLQRAVAPIVSEFYSTAHQRRGTRVMLGTSVVAIEGHKDVVTGVRLTSGDSVPADLVLVGVGVSARTELAEDAGLEVQGGIVVNEFAQTSDPRVVAAGDCTALPSPTPPHELIRLESVQNAVDQAKVAASTLMGKRTAYRPVPWFWSDQDTLKLQIAGISQSYDATIVRGEPDAERFTVLYYYDGRLIAADCINRPADYMAVRRALSRGATMPPDKVTDLSTPLSALIHT